MFCFAGVRSSLEFFYMINHTNLGPPNPAFSAVGNANDAGSVGLTNTSSRQIQFAETAVLT
jgi:hypothetical protein